MTARNTWKQRERNVAEVLGGQRIPVTGIDRHGADVVTPLLHVQVKHGRNRPSYLRDWLDGICGTAKDAGKVGIVVWSAPREAQGDALVVMRLSDFESLHGTLRPAADSHTHG